MTTDLHESGSVAGAHGRLRLRAPGLRTGFAAMLALMVVLASTGFIYVDSMQQQLERIAGNHMKKIQLASRMRIAARERTLSLQKMILIEDFFERDAQWIQFNNLAGEFIIARQGLLDMVLSPAEQKLLDEQGALTNQAVPLQNAVVDLVKGGHTTGAQALLVEKAIPAQDRVLETLNKLHALQEEMAADAVAHARRDYEGAWILLATTVAAVMVLGVTIAFGVVRRVRLADRALQQEKDRAQVTLHAISEGVVRVGAGGLVEYLNPTVEKLVEMGTREARGRPIDDVLAVARASDRISIQALIGEAIARNTAVSGGEELTLMTRTGAEYGIELTATPIHNIDGQASGTVLVLRDVTEVRALSRELSYQATHDALTGLFNRREFERQLAQVLDHARLAHIDSALCYIDLDLFKVVNDTCGHAAGDELLKQLSMTLARSVRRGDLIARLGGDEFAILLRSCSLDAAHKVAEEVRRSVRDFHFVWEDKGFEIGASIGVVRISADSGSPLDVVRAADLACHLAKDEGRNRVHTLRKGDLDLARRQGEIDWVQRIRSAIDENRLVLYAQRIQPLRSASGASAHFEILVRLLDETGAMNEPQAFLSAAERYHLMPAIDQWVIERTFAVLAARGVAVLAPHGAFNINLSGQSLSSPETLPFILRQADRHDIAPAHVCFEITETAAITHMSSAVQLITRLKDRGFRFALDDFGSGLSSFGYLKTMKVDLLKIDGVFIRGIAEDRADRAMVQSINQVAHTMGIETVAEFVETDAIRETLIELGIDFAQGSIIATPESLEHVLAAAGAARDDGTAVQATS